MKKLIPKEEWYQMLVDDCKSILTEGIFTVRSEVIKMKWELGNRILEEEKMGVTNWLKQLSEDINLSERELWRCLEFRKKFPTLKELWERIPEGKNISWHKLVNKYIDFEIPKPNLLTRVTVKFDEWDLTKVWDKLQKEEKFTELILKAKDKPFALSIKEAKLPKSERESDVFKKKLSELYKELDDLYIELKGIRKSDLGSDDYARIHKAIKLLLEKAHLDVEKVKYAMQWCKREYKDMWTLETVVKKYPDIIKRV